MHLHEENIGYFTFLLEAGMLFQRLNHKSFYSILHGTVEWISKALIGTQRESTTGRSLTLQATNLRRINP